MVDDQADSAFGRWWTDLDCQTVDRETALRALYDARPDLVLVDCPEDPSRAIELIATIRSLSTLPILAAAGTGDAGVHALRAGADSVVPKPVSQEELVLRIGRLLCRAGRTQFVIGDALVELDHVRYRVISRGQEIALTPTEFSLLRSLMEHPGAVFPQQRILEMVWGDPYRDPAEVKLYVSYLRRKFAPTGVDPIETVRGVGYRYRPLLLDQAVN